MFLPESIVHTQKVLCSTDPSFLVFIWISVFWPGEISGSRTEALSPTNPFLLCCSPSWFFTFFLSNSDFFLWSAFTSTVLLEAHQAYVLALKVFNSHDLHSDVAHSCGYTLQCLIITAPCTSLQGYTGGLEDIFHLIWVLLENIHHGLKRSACTAIKDVQKWDHFNVLLISIPLGRSSPW